MRPQQPAADDKAAADGDKAAADGKPADAEAAADEKPMEDGASAETGTAPDSKVGPLSLRSSHLSTRPAPVHTSYTYCC